ncbi:uncharacterized protein Z518_03060 [Rhinocladiella mackenziei CBS 650.93]|uniref:Rhinocladiella mackenziei CBS 650.93 unplaced genomic scaffold supercont1.2, whole genome shotgun sequence n=1 Tax=Rhinocladiella mackenziei CBS 650.93 TaxID=1442369 RepID=A0A0D2IR02_9EURO|nr:uncharacterized protein Z518_03060 [Rhinocladiella mackenziei CBS 650.93]KIX08404.1 hypothetical protein Z518_03060 [Rhinocladiella mackenziei CBS 650.93]
MPLVNTTSVAAGLLLLYLSSFVLLAILRFVTGISIQRIGYFSLRHISYTPREGLRIDLRGLGLSLHRPTFAQPTWISLVFQELKITFDPAAFENIPAKSNPSKDAQGAREPPRRHGVYRLGGRSQLWKKLTNIKERIKRIHRKVYILRMFDISAFNTSVEIVDVGYVQVSTFTGAVYTRRKLLDRGRLFRHKKDPLGEQKPAEWVFAVKSILMGVGGRDPIEILDAMTINVHGLLYKEREGLRDTSIAIKAGRLYVPVDEIMHFSNRGKKIAKVRQETQPLSPVPEVSPEDVVEEFDSPGSREASIVQTVADSKEFFSSTLQSVQEIQVGLSFVRISKEVESLRQANLPLTANVVIHEIGTDLHRLDQNSPAHRMYFGKEDIAHQALVAAVSISVSLDEDDAQTNKIMYIPMATITIRTTLPAKTMSFTQDRDVAERNTNILFANLVVTSPSLDLVPQHLIRLLALTQPHKPPSPNLPTNRHRLISRLLPKASIKMSVHEPVVRFVLPVANPAHAAPGEYDMIISSISSISLDVESSHSAGGELLYSLGSKFRVMSHRLYYQASTGIKHNLLITEALELKIHVAASTEIFVTVSGNLRTFSILMVREEVSKAIYNIVRHFKHHGPADRVGGPKPTPAAFLRKLPSWLLEANFEGSGCSIETAGVDSSISGQTRGVALELQSWTAHYTSSQAESSRKPLTRRKTSTSVRYDETFPGNHISPPTSPPRRHHSDPTDGRRLAFHVKGFEGFVIESLESWEPKPFMSVPRFETAFSTSRDQQGPIFHIHSAIRAVYLDFSLYRFYSIGVAGSVVKDAFLGPVSAKRDHKPHSTAVSPEDDRSHMHTTPPQGGVELFAIDVKAHYVHIKAQMPRDPPMLLQIYELSSGRHRWSAPFLRAELLRLHTEAPHLKRVWARLVSTNSIRVDLRQNKKRSQHGTVEEKSIDVTTDFIRLAVPHGLQMYKVFDNFINMGKAMVQLHHRFKTRTNEYILRKDPVVPKKVPRISLRSKALCFELEDDPFEWKLGVIYRVGRIEQKQRLAREDAFRLKVKRTNDERRPRSLSRFRAHSSRRASPNTTPEHHPRRSGSLDNTPRRRSHSRGRRGREQIRYDREGVCALTSSAKIQNKEAWDKLQVHNARSWKKRIDWMLRLQNNTIKNIRQMFTGADEPPDDNDEQETILAIPSRPGLMTVIVSDLHLLIDKPSFPQSDLPKFLHDIGKGLPFDTKYAVLIPVSVSLDMGEARIMLRDYPLSLLHIPAIRPGQPPRLPSWSLKTDFVIAEEFRDDESMRHIKVEIVPRGQHGQTGEEIPGFAIDVRRTVAPVKTYSRPVIDINTSLPTTISWGTSYQPVIQDMMMIIEGFTKPVVDPSERVGFWDKIRLSFHSRLTVNWKGDGDVQLRLKGSRDPYVVTGYGAGFVMCWRNDVQWSIHHVDDPRKFMTVRSGEYVLAIPDYSHEARNSSEQKAGHDSDSVSTSSTQKNAAIFKKVIMKVSGNVQWTAGLVFERDLGNGGRSSIFKNHYDVILKNPTQTHNVDWSTYDAFHGFRSHHIHLSIAVAAPFDRDWTGCDPNLSGSYNSIHLSPRFFSHFFNWWSNFSGVMSLPIRQGPLWSGPEKSSKKFGRHLATIKYSLLLSPLFIAHVYKHKDAEDYQEDIVSATGLKIKIDSFMLDLHQRREYFDTLSKGVSKKQMRTSGMKINKAELDFVKADLRAVAASIAGTTAEDLQKATDEMLSSFQEVSTNIDMSQFTIPDHDFTWIDMDDFVELDWVLPSESNPETKILPLAFTPRFTYFRQTDHGGGIQGDPSRTSPFGDEDTHFCVMSRHNDPRKVQMNLIETRLKDLEDRLQVHVRLMGEHELRVVRDGDHDQAIKDKHDTLLAQQKELESKRRFLQHGLRRLTGHANPGEAHEHDHPHRHGSTPTLTTELDSQATGTPQVDMDGLYTAGRDEFASDFNNRFIIHNVQLKWNNSLRNVILRYSHQVGQRRGFVYYMSRRAVKFILDIVDEQAKAKEERRKQERKQDAPMPPTPSVISPSEEKDEDSVIEDRITQLLNDAKRFVHVGDEIEEDSPTADAGDAVSERRPSTIDLGDKIAENFQAMNSYHLRLIAPQIQLQSEKNTKSIVLISAKGMQLKVVSIMDKARMSDDVSGLVQRRFALDMDGAQFFVASQKTLAKYLHLYSGNRYGNTPGSSWPPWVSLEAMFDFHLEPFGFRRVIQKTSASLRYEKYNPLRLKYNEEVESKENGGQATHASRKENRMDHLYVDFPRVRARCDSAQYYAMYIIVLDLLLYSEPLEKTRSERLEKIMLASDFSDLRGAPEMAERLQERIRQLEDIKLHFQINAKYLDKQGWQDRINLEKDIASCEDELFFIMKAINTSQQKNDDRKASQSSGLLRWYLSASEIVWHLMRDRDEPLTEFQLGNAAYERIDNIDGSNHNALEIEHIRGWNLLPNALYPEIIGPYYESGDRRPSVMEMQKMVQVHWYMLEAIAGIPVLEEFHVTVFPLKVQLERELGKKLFEYIFPGVGSNAFENGNFSPLMVKNMEPLDDGGDQELEEARSALMSEQDLRPPSSESSRGTSPGAVARRLKPTYRLTYDEKHSPSTSSHGKSRGLGISSDHHNKLFKHFNNSNPRSALKEPTRKGSAGSLRSKKNEASSTSLVALSNSEEKKRNIMYRTSSKDRSLGSKKDKNKPSDDLSQMMSRASNYMTLAHVKLNSFVICLSYKGKSDRNFEDLHDFVFRMPTLEYRNKTWSNLELALRLKKDVIRALISHTGAIIGNKFSHHRPNKKQVERLKEIAHSSTIANSDINLQLSGTSETTSLYSFSQDGRDDDFESSGISFQSPSGTNGHKNGVLGPSPLLRSGSWTSSVNLSITSGFATPRNMPPPGAVAASSNSLIVPPRPSTASPHGPRSLLKDAIGRHFSGDTVKGRVHIGGLGLGRSETHRESRDSSHRDKDKDTNHYLHPNQHQNQHQHDDGAESDPESHRRKSVLLLGKKVLHRLS